MRALAVEATIWRSLFGWRRTAPPDGVRRFGYGRQIRPLLIAVAALAVIEGIVIDFIIGLLTDSILWPVLAAAIHVYALCWILGVIASLRTRPHEFTDTHIVLRNSVFAGIDLPLSSVDSVRPCRTARSGFSGLEVDADARTAMLCHGEATVRLALTGYEIDGHLIDSIDVTVDETAAFVAAARGKIL